MAKTEVILTHNIVGLGGESDQVRVAAGYARNFLFPQGLAIPLTGANKRRLEALKQRRAEREAHELNTMTELAKGVAKLTCLITVKTGEDGKMFGTVTSGMIADQLKTQFEISLDKRKIHLDQTIRTLGDHEVELRLHQDVTARLKVHVESSTPLPEAPPAPAAPEGKKEEPRTEKRGRRFEPGADKGPRADKVDKGDKPHDRPHTGDRRPRPARPGGPPHGGPRGPRPDRAPRGDRPAGDRPAGDRPAKAEKPEKSDKPAPPPAPKAE